MFYFLCKRLGYKVKLVGIAHHQLGVSETILSTKFTSSFSSSSSSPKKKTPLSTVKDEQGNSSSFTVSYLMNSCGLSFQNAVKASKFVQFEMPNRPDSVLELLTSHGFTETHIAKLIRSRPEFLISDPQKTLLPNLEFLKSIGLSITELPRIVSNYPALLARNVDKHMISTHEFIKSIVHDDEKVVFVVKNSPTIFQVNVQKNLAPNITFLRNLGVPSSSISIMLTRYGLSLQQNRDKFEQCVNKLIEMKFKLSAKTFILAVRVLAVSTKSTWNHKMEVYKKWDWSETDFDTAFRINPVIMNLSETKITHAMDFFVNKMGLKASVLSKKPVLLCLSLEKRIIPRCSVIKCLTQKGLVKKNLSLSSYLDPTEKAFLEKFVIKYEEKAPELFNVYQGKVAVY